MDEIKIQLACSQDVDEIEKLFSIAKESMRLNGNTVQWSQAYPSSKLILQDIENKHCYLVLYENKIVGVFSCIPGIDPTYKNIYQGAWLNSAPYASIHRIASSGEVKGITKHLFKFCFQKFPNIRIDTHPANNSMQHILQKEGFSYCGRIRSAERIELLAFQKTI